jgi:hypothetical protein
MNKPDELERLWQTQPVQTDIKGEEMRQIILRKTEKFDRTVRWRNLREVLASAVAGIVFGYLTWKQANGIARLGSALITGTMAWIIYYFWRHGSGPADPNPDQSAAAFQSALVSKIDHQIRLLRNVKFWYLLPMYVGLLVFSAGGIRDHAATGSLSWRDAISPILCTLFFALIWWLNEGYAVNKLERWKTKLAAGIQPGDSGC